MTPTSAASAGEHGLESSEALPTVWSMGEEYVGVLSGVAERRAPTVLDYLAALFMAIVTGVLHVAALSVVACAVAAGAFSLTGATWLAVLAGVAVVAGSYALHLGLLRMAEREPNQAPLTDPAV